MKKLLFILMTIASSAIAQQQVVNVGSSANDGTGDNLRAAFVKVNANDAELYANILASATASGTNTYTATPDPAIASYATGQKFVITFTNANSASSTINLNGLGAKTLKKDVTTNLASGDIKAGGCYLIVYDGTNFQVIGVGGGGGSGDMTAAVYDPQNINGDAFDLGNHTGVIDVANINGLTPTVTELNYVDGVTSSIQTQIDTKLNYSKTKAITIKFK